MAPKSRLFQSAGEINDLLFISFKNSYTSIKKQMPLFRSICFCVLQLISFCSNLFLASSCHRRFSRLQNSIFSLYRSACIVLLRSSPLHFSFLQHSWTTILHKAPCIFHICNLHSRSKQLIPVFQNYLCY